MPPVPGKSAKGPGNIIRTFASVWKKRIKFNQNKEVAVWQTDTGQEMGRGEVCWFWDSESSVRQSLHHV